MKKLDLKKSVNILINNLLKNNTYIEYETINFISLINKYPNDICKYREQIYLTYMQVFKNIHESCMQLRKKTNCFKIYNIGYYYYLWQSLNNYIIKERLNILFNFIFNNKQNLTINVQYLISTMTGHDIIRCYIKNNGVFNIEQTMILMNSISLNNIDELRCSMINIIEENDVFAITDDLIEYATFIPLNKYIYRCITKNYKINQKSFYNIIRYSNDIELCKIGNNMGNKIDIKCLENACYSKNKKILEFVLNYKIIPNQKCCEIIFEFEHFHNFENQNIYLYQEQDIYHINVPFYVYLLRTISKEDYYNSKELINILCEYGYILSKEDFLLALKNKVLIEQFQINVNDTEFMKLYYNICTSTSFYPYFINKNFPIPTIECLYNECNKKGNLKIIKLLCNIIKPDLKCLEIAKNIKKNVLTIKYLQNII